MERRIEASIASIMVVHGGSFLLLVVVVVLLVVAPSPSCAITVEQQQQDTMLRDWVKKQATAAKDAPCTCGKKDAALSAAEANRVVLRVEPPDDSGTSDPGSYINTISDAIAKIPDGNTKRYVISIRGGAVFREKVFLPRSKPFVTFSSDTPDLSAVIVWNDTAATPGKDGKPLGADGSSSVTIESDYFIASGVVFRNDALNPQGTIDEEVSTGNMAPALRVVGSKATFYRCSIEGGQGALYDHKGLHYYKSCTINGTFDFILGNARSFYEDCNIVSTSGYSFLDLPAGKPPLTLSPAAAADGGFSFKTCTIAQESFLFLGRAGWPVVYSYTNIHELIPFIVSGSEDGLSAGTKFQINRELSPYFYASLHSYGGVQLNYTEAAPFLGTQFVSGDNWILSLPPQTE